VTDAEIREKVVSYRKVHQNFGIWQRLRTESADVKYVALYLSTGPMSHPVGIYHLSFSVMLDHLAFRQPGRRRLRDALARLELVGEATYDHETAPALVPRVAAEQIGPELTTSDRRHKWVCRQLLTVSGSWLIRLWLTTYGRRDNIPPDLCERLEKYAKPFLL